ncbi:GDP-L-galactose phosphorylase 1-like isoform X2 [Rhododendron vialii]|uniref:GDP-L-galactose phosphorylase 1-like isoform X2 n=1 Tax=Rhododendron vialii TaxID=182163 RepID=UPI00265DA00F|nr:GDP-L-galactose phosphorylase 1-like isoform X2 [Rhododendron vialii]
MEEKMLTIKRVPTVVSNYQVGGGSEDTMIQSQTLTLGCGRNCLGKCCLPVSKLPLYAFKKDEYESTDKFSGSSCSGRRPVSFLNNLLLAKWEERMKQGLFRYDVTTCETKIIPGDFGFIAQLNEGRHLKKRPTEFRVDQVLQPFDDTKFNFTKVGQEEVLFRFEQGKYTRSHFCSSSPVNADSNSPNVVAINRIDHESFLLALHMAKVASEPSFRLGYNSLGAFATINHLHFQAYYLSVPFPVEKAPTQRIRMGKDIPDNGVVVSQLLNYPVRGFVFEGGLKLRNLSNAVASSCIRLQNKNIPFNVLIADCGRKIFLFPQCYAKKLALGEVSDELLDTQVNPAVWEISGHMVLKRRKDYDDASEKNACRLLAEVSLSEERFEEVKAHILEAAGLQEVESVGNGMNEEESLQKPHPPHVTSHLTQDCMVLH